MTLTSMPLSGAVMVQHKTSDQYVYLYQLDPSTYSRDKDK